MNIPLFMIILSSCFLLTAYLTYVQEGLSNVYSKPTMKKWTRLLGHEYSPFLIIPLYPDSYNNDDFYKKTRPNTYIDYIYQTITDF